MFKRGQLVEWVHEPRGGRYDALGIVQEDEKANTSGRDAAGRVDLRPYSVLVYWLDYQESSREYSADIRLYEKKKRK